MKYTLTEVTEIPPDGRKSRVSATYYSDIIKDFIQKQLIRAEVEVPDKNPDNVARSLETHAPHEVSVINRGARVYLQNNALVTKEVE